MSIKYWTTLPSEIHVFQKAVRELVRLGRIPNGLPLLPFRVPVDRLTFEDVVKPPPESLPAPRIWRYFAGGQTPDYTVSGDVDATSTPAVNNLVYGGAAYRTLKAIEGLEQQKALPAAIMYRPRYLQIPGLLVEAIRLEPVTPKSSKDRYILPYHTTVNVRARLGTDPIREDKFFGNIQDVAKRIPRKLDDRGDDRAQAI